MARELTARDQQLMELADELHECDHLAGTLRILANAIAAARDAALEEAADEAEAHSCTRACSESGSLMCAHIVAACIRALKGRA